MLNLAESAGTTQQRSETITAGKVWAGETDGNIETGEERTDTQIDRKSQSWAEEGQTWDVFVFV